MQRSLSVATDVSVTFERLTQLPYIREPRSDTLLDVHAPGKPRGHPAAVERIGPVDTDARRSDEPQLFGVPLAGDHVCTDRHRFRPTSSKARRTSVTALPSFGQSATTSTSTSMPCSPRPVQRKPLLARWGVDAVQLQR